ncbi:hypothetical protein HG536_0H01260 [Torulaspora globosa]|uniref:glucan endo-1,3-beta-D-glucosidase n=1 Tax=Torulaspora globosa TaxID=48254 RepID=A0A7G3ZML5_9SACH|nr:uncharacterized protein HG536_0H01260 [Torulaspora globosa]QLL34751.1 hypothetical protein HG536_0H01260 [Torulaspora globosa]
MKFIKSLCAASLTALSVAQAGCVMSGGNYYCSETDAVVFSNVGYSGSYKDVTSMDESSGVCLQDTVSFSGSLAPLDEELSVHFRGPLRLLQFGVYYPSGGSSLGKRDNQVQEEPCEETVQSHKHKREVAVEYVQVTSTVYVNNKGQPVTSSVAQQEAPGNPATDVVSSYTFVNTIVTPSTSATPSTGTSATTVLTGGRAGSSSPEPASSSSIVSLSSSTKSSASASSTSGSSTSGAWVRSSYFQPGSASNCVFMNHQGGSAGSGVWSAAFGNSICYASSDGVSGASSAQALGDVTIKSGQEYMIFSGSQCSGNDCGYYRKNIPAYHGFGGENKIFVFEFSMPYDTAGSGYNQDMPAIWFLNAKIPRTLQYGKSECSCWKTGCGEFDLFEILSPGSDKLITHVHDGQGSDGTSTGGGGTQDYFQRPTSGTMKAAVIFNGSDKTIHIVKVDDDFDAQLSSDVVNSWLQKSGSTAALA